MLHKPSLKKKLFGASSCVSVFILIASLIGIVNLKRSNADLKEILEIKNSNIAILTNIKESQTIIAKSETGLLNSALFSAINTDIQERWRHIEKLKTGYDTVSKQPEQKKLWKTYTSLLDTWRDRHGSAVQDIQNSDSLAGSGTHALSLLNESAKAFEKTNTALDELITMHRQAIADIEKENSKNTAASVYILILIIAFGFFAAFLLGLYFTKTTLSPLNRVIRILKEMDEGSLKSRSNIHFKDEVGQLAGILDSFADKLEKHLVGGMYRLQTAK